MRTYTIELQGTMNMFDSPTSLSYEVIAANSEEAADTARRIARRAGYSNIRGPQNVRHSEPGTTAKQILETAATLDRLGVPFPDELKSAWKEAKGREERQANVDLAIAGGAFLVMAIGSAFTYLTTARTA